MSRLVLIDGNAILHRAYHAIPHLTNSAGEPTNAVYGFVAILLRVIEDLKPTHLVVAFDRPKPTFRKELYKEYQAHRPEMEDALVSQVHKVHRVIKSMGIPIFEKDGYEADDVIASLAKQANEIPNSKHQIPNKPKNPISKLQTIDEIMVVTGDRDLLQLVDDRVKLYMPVKGLSESKVYGEKEAQERMGVTPRQIPDFKALAGDPSDNYPGVAGIGPKTAADLLRQFKTLDNIYQHLTKVAPKIREKLVKDKANAFLSQKLATVVTDAPIEFDPQVAQIPEDLLTQSVSEAFGELGFKTLLNRLSKMSRKAIPEEKQMTKKSGEQMGLF